ncbi:PPR repeat protein [Coccidioides immitis RMSCC 2394]|uniref:PPR repeat protein n=1 Tax=Coccidioides immitis RMSCC 2394 TaxID=404692 RepID=A0A0J7ATH8_COCIT|nr:PPR repeat protein [Coccidioides immitis RMSCC 2394]
MVFKPFTHLARQTFSKTFAHGYAQSVVAASQSSYASSATSLNQITSVPGKFTRTAQLQSAFQNASGSSSSAGAKAGHAASNYASADSGLAAYFAAWQLAQQTGEDGDWKQYQFTRRIGWKAGAKESKEEESKPERESADEQDSASLSHSSLNDGRSVRSVESAPVDKDVSARVDEAVAREIQQIQEAAELTDSASVVDSAELLESKEATSAEITPVTSVEDAAPSPKAPRTPRTPVRALRSTQATNEESNRIVELAAARSFSQVPIAFEKLLKDGVVPSIGAYNALLQAAIHLHSDVYHAVPKALDIYSDMIRRNVMPNEQTYQTLVRLLSTRALDCQHMVQNLEQARIRYGGMDEPGKSLFRSSEVEHELLTEDHSLSIALKLFTLATSRHHGIVFSLDIYRSLLTACAMKGEVDKMIQIFAHMEKNKVAPHAAMFPPMIDAFAAGGDLKSAVECYNEYRTLAIADDSGVFGVVDRKDGEVYAAVVKAYMNCGKTDGALRFFDKIRTSFDGVENREQRLKVVEDVVVKDGMVQHSIKAGNFVEALKTAQNRLGGESLRSAVLKICESAADAGESAVASEAYDLLSAEKPGSGSSSETPVVAMMAMHIRQGDLVSAKSQWAILASNDHVNADLIQPTAMYAVALLRSGQTDEGLSQARNMFAKIRNASPNKQGQLREEIDEAIDLFGRVLMQSSPVLSAHAAMTLIWAMVENGGLVSPVAEHAIASLGPMEISQLSVHDLNLALQVQAGMLINGSPLFDAAHPARFAHMLELAMSTGLPFNHHTKQLLDQGVSKVSVGRPELLRKWQHFTQGSAKPTFVSPRYSPTQKVSPAVKPTHPEDSFDPYAHSTDFRGSSMIAEELENTRGRPEDHLNTAMIKFRNMRRIGRHPRYITYAKLITAAAKCGRMNLVHEILGMARHDVPLIPQYGAVKYGWTSILDAMVAASLTAGERGLAAKYHQELLNMGAAPSANTFGLYITTLKESTKTFDEATEAVKIFHRAMSEGVEPTSFLYNALIGKLGKARRIDDCLLYFAEMRANGVRPTSVTYGTIVNALCRVSDERFAEEMFDEMESMPNYKPRPAPYNSLIQYFLNTKRDRSKVLAYYERMKSKNIEPTMHTYKLLIDAYASLEPVNMEAAEGVLETIRSTGQQPEGVHFASLVHAKGCVLHDMEGARKVFDSALSSRAVRPQACLYQALFEAMVANHKVTDTPALLESMTKAGVEMTPYIANTLIHGWATEGNVNNAKSVYESIGIQKREPSTYEAMTRAFLAAEDRQSASAVVQEMLSRGYPSAVASKVVELVSGGNPPTPVGA